MLLNVKMIAKRTYLFNDFCRSCWDEEEEESIAHYLCYLTSALHKFLGKHFCDCLAELALIGNFVRTFEKVKTGLHSDSTLGLSALVITSSHTKSTQPAATEQCAK